MKITGCDHEWHALLMQQLGDFFAVMVPNVPIEGRSVEPVRSRCL
jgi:hypothetical protein